MNGDEDWAQTLAESVGQFREIVDDLMENNLCPHDDCAHELRIPAEGWYRCDNCRRVFYAEETSEENGLLTFERYTLAEWGEEPPEGEIPVAEDIGEYWDEEFEEI